MDDDRIASSDKIQQLLKLGTFGVLARGVIRKCAVKFQALQLSAGLLVKGTDPDVAYALSCHIPHLLKKCQDRVYDFHTYLSRNTKLESILTEERSLP